MKNINSISPIIRDSLLIENIGKYNQISTRLIYPIGISYDIYGAVPIKKESILPNGLLGYINKNKEIKKTGELEQTTNIPNNFNRNSISVDLGYDNIQPQKYSYVEGKTYNDPKDKNWLSMGIDSVISFVMGDNVGLNLGSNGVELVSTGLEKSTSIVGRLAEVVIGDTPIGNIGIKSLGVAFANTLTQKSRMLDSVQDFFKKPVDFYNAIDTLELDKLTTVKMPGFAQNLVPIYFYTEVKNDNFTKNTSWVNNQSVVYELNTQDEVSSYYKDLSAAPQSLLSKTKKLFENGKIESMITDTLRFTSNGDNNVGYGINRQSRGRNLSKKDVDDIACRVWTVNNQYNKLSSLIRPFNSDKADILKKDLNRVRPKDDILKKDSTSSLKSYGVLQDNGFVKFGPTKDDNFKDKSKPKNYMFSIENLAWKDSIDSLIENTSQEGPNGGRIMWFPPYDISFNETTSVNWNSETFIGRGEPIYTYVNTERGGTLNFKIIVDHPSIINYYKQKDPNGIQIVEEDYLRFFAGCDVIDLEKVPDEIKPIPVTPTTPTSKNKPTTKKFKVFFPNNYSGIFDGEDAITYLMYGENCSIDGGSGYENIIGWWSGLTTYIASKGDPCYLNDYYYRVDSQEILNNENAYEDTRSFGLNSKAVGDYSFRQVYEYLDVPFVTPSEDYLKRSSITNYYMEDEITEISYIDMLISQNDLNIAIATSGTTIQSLTEDYNNKKSEYELNFKSLMSYLATYTKYNTGENSNSMSIEITTNDNGISNTSFDNELNEIKSVYNTYSKQNPATEKKLTEYLNVKYKFALGTATQQELTNVLNEYNNSKSDLDIDIEDLTSECTKYISKADNKSTFNEFTQVLNDATGIAIIGCASHQGTNTSNTILSGNRAKTIANWLKNYNSNDSIYKLGSAYKAGVENTTGDPNDEVFKKERYVIVEITTQPTGLTLNNVASNNDLTLVESKINTTKINTTETKTGLRVKKSMYGYFYDSNNPTDESKKTMNDEAMFFEKLGESSDGKFIFDKLSEKIKYFHPAFHSTTPEGFNSRLTFLHQCTRQGPTLASTDMTNNKRSASNMAFGRPPICILRIGDFYDTKVVFESLNIDFDPLVWDLNQEGIGVQPMIATISMNFKFIGGSDLTGPIARLQNAITFNFFANTGVYDDRNDRYVSNSNLMKQSSIDTGGVYIPQYDTLYNPGVYDSKTISKTTETVGATPETASAPKPVDITASLAKVTGKDTTTETKRSEIKEVHRKKTTMYVYTATFDSAPSILIRVIVTNSLGSNINTIKVNTLDLDLAFETARKYVNDNMPWLPNNVTYK